MHLQHVAYAYLSYLALHPAAGCNLCNLRCNMLPVYYLIPIMEDSRYIIYQQGYACSIHAD